MTLRVSRRMRDEDVRHARTDRLGEAHVAPLTGLVEQIREERQGVSVPWFDPDSGGIAARILLLLEAPGPMAAPAPASSSLLPSGFVSLDNDDATAATLHDLVAEAGLARNDVLMWNIVPWYLGDSHHTRVRSAKTADIEEGRIWIRRLVELLPHLGIAILLGEKSLHGWFKVAAQVGRPIPALACPHPSPRSLNPHPERRQAILETLKAAAVFSKT